MLVELGPMGICTASSRQAHSHSHNHFLDVGLGWLQSARHQNQEEGQPEDSAKHKTQESSWRMHQSAGNQGQPEDSAERKTPELERSTA
ncbi:hypothetical protein BY996DRAFT_6542018 [Phakopsora pachyrhizi]|uniref:Uncharacterized protein n=1 Tax=Phakopsora pachyrhizi TaxID=170000 RepID=A0AAV0B293_PHAPC|nr:hypothetical protein BY996DRAFT_6542018 [Phakopsora pachyrhizi]CAH7676130.1 hypothetical protein PPACK8108_LOCUS11228 [Phakopsora pachyrhizi]